MTDDFIGRTLGQYRIEAPLGSGGMGQVFRGMHVYLDRPVAIKVMQAHVAADPTFRARFLQEAKSAAALKHPNIVEIYDFGEQDGHLYLVMELMTNGSLRTLLRQRRTGQPLPLSLGLDLVRQAAEGLAAAHAMGTVHRDIKPDNLLLNRLSPEGQEPGQYQLKISDFGLARMVVGSGLTATGVPMGTVNYMSPEQCQAGKLDGRSDLYSLGVVLYEVATGYLPFQIDNFTDAFNKHIFTPPPSPRQVRPDLPPDVEAIILRCLAKKPDERYATGSELAQALQRALGGAWPETVTQPYLAGQSPPQMMTNYSSGQSAPVTQSKQPTHVLSPSSQAPPPPQAYQQISKTEPALPVTELEHSTGSPISRAGRWWLVAVSVMLVLLLLSGGIAYAIRGGFAPPFHLFSGGGGPSNGPASSATVTITPASRDLKTPYTIPAVTGTPDASQHQVHARTISTQVSQSQTANASGVKQVPAVRATGELLFFTNYTVSYPAGSIFTGNSGIQVATDADVNLPDSAGNDTLRIAAHAVTAGSSGNIPAGDINQGSNSVFSCPIGSNAMSDIVVSNMPQRAYLFISQHPEVPLGGSTTVICNPQAFTGGQDAYYQSVVQQSDINNTYDQAKSLEPGLTQNAQSALQAQVHGNEQLISSPQCASKFTYDHAVGDASKSVTATITVTCTGEAYYQQEAWAMAEQLLKQDAARNPGPGYTLVGKVVTIQTKAQISDASQGTIAVSVTAEGVWVYQVSDAQKLVLAKLIAGRKKGIVQSLLLQQPGVAKVDIQLSGGDGNTFPSDSNKIKVVVTKVTGK